MSPKTQRRKARKLRLRAAEELLDSRTVNPLTQRLIVEAFVRDIYRETQADVQYSPFIHPPFSRRHKSSPVVRRDKRRARELRGSR